MSTTSRRRISSITPSANQSVKENTNPNVVVPSGVWKKLDRAHETVSVRADRPSLSSFKNTLAPRLPFRPTPTRTVPYLKRISAPNCAQDVIHSTNPIPGAPSRPQTTNAIRMATTSKLSRCTTSGQASSHRASGVPSKLSDFGISVHMRVLRESAQRLSTQVDHIASQLYDKDTQLTIISKEKSNAQGSIGFYEKQIHKTKSFLDRLEQELWALKCRHKTELDGLQSALDQSEAHLQSSGKTIQEKTKELEQKNDLICKLESNLSCIQQQNLNLQQSLNDLQNEVHHLSSIIETQRTTISAQKLQIQELETQALEDEQTRRHLHNIIQELKGNIRVYCRVRGLLPEEKIPSSKDDSIYYAFNKFDPTSFEIVQKQPKDVTGYKTVPDKKHFFKFDYVFQSNATQKSVFAEISQLVQSALDGYHACIFAYGQTGSGKTYTMEGPEDSMLTEETEGMISRAVKQIFSSSDKLQNRGWQFEIHASFLEIYNENIRDLLDPKNSTTKKCDVKHDVSTGQTTVSNLLVVHVKTPDQVYELLRTASKNRMVGATRLNLHSSRSHCVFQLRITGKNDTTSNTINGLLNMIDLAGSERVSASGATGDRFTETKYINKSLSCLKNVISALANKDKHVPFRDSKLTYLLQNSLGGHSKTLMFVNISPSPANFNETINSLRFASQVNACEIGTAKKITRIDLGD